MSDAILTSPLCVTAPEPAGISSFPVVHGPYSNPPTQMNEENEPILSSEKKLDTSASASTAASTQIPQIPITLRSPHKDSSASTTKFEAPPLEWLQRTWTVTHSTLPMWKKSKNVRITYKILPQKNGPDLLDDTVENVPTEKTWMPQPKTIKGIDTPVGDGAWKWRGSGMLKMTTSNWEVLGWGERDGERWVVTWFEASMFTPAGVDVYCDQKKGISEGLYNDIKVALEKVEAVECSALLKGHMFAVVIDDA